MKSDLKNLQPRVKSWLSRVFGSAVLHRKERAFRFVEEAVELAQALGLSREEIIRVVDYVMSREVGEIRQEIGGSFVTLLAVCVCERVDAGEAACDEMDRAETPEIVDKVLTKQREKKQAGVAVG